MQRREAKLIIMNRFLGELEVRVLIDPSAAENFLSKTMIITLGLPLRVDENEKVNYQMGILSL